MKRLSCRVTGRVQLVMFRDFTQRNAKYLDLVGWVKNNADGSVSLVAEGPENKLEELVKRLHKGSILSRVDGVETSWEEATEEFNGFEIRY